MPDLSPVFDELRALMLTAAPGAVATLDGPGHIDLKGPATDPKTGEPAWFGMVKTGARAVSYHLPPLYHLPSLADGLSPALKKRQQGKTCFNFTKVDPVLFDELSALTRRCAKEAI